MTLTVRLISFHHRLAHMTGHRYAEALGLVAATRARGMELALFISEHAVAPLRSELPMAHPVLHCPVFRTELSFDERTADFKAMLHQHLDGVVRRDDWVLVTTGTQCEARALAAWLGEVPIERRPWALTLIHSDRWNRYGHEERERQLAEFRTTAAELAGLDAHAKLHFIVGSLTDDLCAELRTLLGVAVHRVPQILPGDGYVPRVEKSAAPLIGIVGGARPEKGSHRVRAIIEACRKIRPVGFAVQVVNELLPADAFAELADIAGEAGVEVVPGPLDQSAYRALLARCDLLLLPYERIPYRKRASGIFVEAAFAGRPAVVPSGTWMAQQIESGAAAGMVYEGDDPATIAATLARAADALAELARQAKVLAPEWQRTMTLDAFLDWLDAEISRRKRSSSSSAYGETKPLLRSRCGAPS